MIKYASMKKIFAFLFLVFIIRSASSGQNTIDSIVVSNCYHNDLDVGQFNTQTVDSFSGGLLMSKYYQDTANMNFLLDKYFYSPGNKILEHQHGTFVNSIFTMWKQEIYTYDSNDSIIGYINWSSNSTDYRYSFSRDLSGRIFKIVSEGFITTWDIFQVDWYYYSFNDSIDYILTSYPGQNSDSLYLDYTYDSLQNNMTIQEYFWDSSTFAFDDTSDRTMFYYDSFDRLSAKTEAWYFGSLWWERYDSTYWLYDNQGRIDYVQHGSNPHAGFWEDYLYDSTTNLLDSLNYCQWATHSGRCKYCKYSYFKLPLNVTNIEKDQFVLFPNPVSEELNININDNRSLKIRVYIRDVYLQTVYEDEVYVMDGKTQLQMLNYLPGIYFVTLVKNERNMTQKIIIQE